MLELLDFQQAAVNELLEKVSNPVNKNRMIVFKSPTGSGKTIMMIDFISKYIDTIDKNVAFIWLCPGKGDLEEQSRKQMVDFAQNRISYTIYDALTNGFIEGSTTFINWEMITKEGNKAISDSEQKNLYDRIDDARLRNTNFVIIIDEEHSNNTSKAQDIINRFRPINEIRISATAHERSNQEFVEINEEDVIAEGIIASEIYVNPDIEHGIVVEDEVKFLIGKADDIRKKESCL